MNKYTNEFINIFKGTKEHLMNGVNYMIPVVVASGILFAVSTMIMGPETLNEVNSTGATPEGVAGFFFIIGKQGMNLMVLVLSAFIARSIAKDPGIAPGLIGGALSVYVGAGFIGGIFTGFFAGVVAYYLMKIPIPEVAGAVKPFIIVPILSVALTGFFILCVIGQPCAWILDNLQNWLMDMAKSDVGAAAVGALCAGFMAFDMGGPVNKTTYSVGCSLLAADFNAGKLFMGPICIGICVPSLGCGLASIIFKNKFSPAERNSGIGAVIMGLCGMTEAAIPYAAADPIRIFPINIISSAIAGALAGWLGAWSTAAWGGLIILPATNMLPYFTCVVVGTGIHVLLCGIFKKKHVEGNKKSERKKGKNAK